MLFSVLMTSPSLPSSLPPPSPPPLLTPTLTSGGGGGGPFSQIMERMGRRKAAVFPDPVWAQAMRSLLAMMMGRAYFWTGVGLEYWANCGGGGERGGGGGGGGGRSGEAE